MASSPAFSFYAKDFLAATATMSLAERGAYITLLGHQWDAGSVPSSPRERARVLGCTAAQERAIWLRLASKFALVGDAYLNQRLEVERRKQIERREKLAANGKKGGRPVNQKVNQNKTKRLAKEKPNDNQNESLAFSSSSSSSEDPSKNDGFVPAKGAGVHEVRELLAFHELCFTKANHGEKPAKYTAADAKQAKDLTARHGYDKARLIVRQAFVSRDPFIANSGRAISFIASSNVQNRLISEIAAAQASTLPAERPKSLRDIDEMEAKRVS